MRKPSAAAVLAVPLVLSGVGFLAGGLNAQPARPPEVRKWEYKMLYLHSGEVADDLKAVESFEGLGPKGGSFTPARQQRMAPSRMSCDDRCDKRPNPLVGQHYPRAAMFANGSASEVESNTRRG